jgi:hypothetical protein
MGVVQWPAATAGRPPRTAFTPAKKRGRQKTLFCRPSVRLPESIAPSVPRGWAFDTPLAQPTSCAPSRRQSLGLSRVDTSPRSFLPVRFRAGCAFGARSLNHNQQLRSVLRSLPQDGRSNAQYSPPARPKPSGTTAIRCGCTQAQPLRRYG